MPPTTIGVLTFHRCINYGSYWQARCLTEGLRARGHDAVLLDHRSRDVLSRELRCAFQPSLPERTTRRDFPAYAAKVRAFEEAFAALPLSRAFELSEPETMPAMDAVVVGSDEVWNFRHPWYGGCDVFFGRGLVTERLVAYAASIGNHDAADGIPAGYAARLAAFDAIAVRDDNSRSLVERALGTPPPLVLDPVLQFPPDLSACAEGKYLALYGHGFPDWFARHLRAAADALGLPIRSIGYRNAFADEHDIAAGPQRFAEQIAGAAAVATNFFHGAVFSLAAGKPFVAATTPYRLNKLRDLTAKLSARSHLLDEATPQGVYRERLSAPLDPAIGAAITTYRAASTAFLDRALA